MGVAPRAGNDPQAFRVVQRSALQGGAQLLHFGLRDSVQAEGFAAAFAGVVGAQKRRGVPRLGDLAARLAAFDLIQRFRKSVHEAR